MKKLSELFDELCNPSFTAHSKKELELIILDSMVATNYVSDPPREYEMVAKLRITRAKARQLIYDRELRLYSQHDLDDQLSTALMNPLLQKQGDTVALDIESPYLRDRIRFLLRELGHASDGSFSPTLIRVNITAFSALICEILDNTQLERVEKGLVKAGLKKDKSLKGLMSGALGVLGRKVVGEIADEYTEEFAAGVVALMNDSATRIAKVFKADQGEEVV